MTATEKLSSGVEGSAIRRLLAKAVVRSVVLASVQQATRMVEMRLAPVRVEVNRVIRASFLFGWLTKEPEPEVIVIDLRETWTIGPMIAGMDWLILRMLPYWRTSKLKDLLEATAAIIERGLETRPGRVIQRILEPPKQSDQFETAERRTQRDTDDYPSGHEYSGDEQATSRGTQ